MWVITSAIDSRDGLFIEREQPSTASELVSSLSGLPSTFQPVVSPTRANTVPAVSAGINARAGASQNQSFESWFEEYLKQQQQAAAEQEAADEQAAAEQAALEQAAFEAQKQAYKENADVIFQLESPGHVDLTKAQGVDFNDNMFVEVKGDLSSTLVITGEGDDVIYFGDNQNYFYEDFATAYSISTLSGAGNDKIFGGNGTQAAFGGHGDDLIDLGDGYDVAVGSFGADEFAIDLQDSGFDLIADFVSVGDKITIYNGGELAQADEWMLVSVGSEWTGLKPPGSNFQSIYDDGNEFYEIQSADGETAAIFSAGTVASEGASVKYELTIQKGVAGLEVIESSHGYLITEPSVDFV